MDTEDIHVENFAPPPPNISQSVRATVQTLFNNRSCMSLQFSYTVICSSVYTNYQGHLFAYTSGGFQPTPRHGCMAKKKTDVKLTNSLEPEFICLKTCPFLQPALFVHIPRAYCFFLHYKISIIHLKLIRPIELLEF